MNSRFKLPGYVPVFFKRLGILILMMQLTRIIFYCYNLKAFPLASFMDFLAGTWFDLITVSLAGLPFIILSVLPLPIRDKQWYKILLKSIFILTAFFLFLLNIIDVEYFKFTNKRSTVDLFSMLSAGNDFGQQFWVFIKDFWLLLLFLIVFLFITNWLYNKSGSKSRKNDPSSWATELLIFIFVVFSSALIGRGGFGLKPISPLDASRYTKIENAALILNTPFTMIKSFGKEALTETDYYTGEELLHNFSPYKQSRPQYLLPNKTNVVVILLESFGDEFVGAAGAKDSFTPFLDSLSSHSLYFYNGIANGKKSIEGVPAVIASMPSLMDNPYISSPYGSNTIETIPRILKKEGYTSAFFHGATNGSMRFDGFAAQAGFDHYLGRKEYNNDTHFDGTWGILDEYFNPWVAQKLSEFKAPFFGTLFTLSSHHPYYIPPHMKGKLKKGKYPICESIAYADYSLKKFFEEARKQPWYNNTIFILCADHTNAPETSLYSQRTEIFKIPILIFDPQQRITPQKETVFFQHIDIFPTLMDLLNIKTSFYAIGNSYYQPPNNEAVCYLEGTYQYYSGQYMITFSNGEVRNLYNAKIRIPNNPDSLKFHTEESHKMAARLKAIIQTYNRDLIHNQTVTKP